MMKRLALSALLASGSVLAADPPDESLMKGMELKVPAEFQEGRASLELSRFDAPAIASDHRTAAVNSLGYLRVMFTVEDLDDTLARLRRLGATVVDEVVNYEDIYRLCYIRGPEGILIGLAQQLGQQTSRANPMERERS